MAKQNYIDQLYKEIGENDCNQNVTGFLSTGILPLNKAISGNYQGGIPIGRITEIFGAASSSKTLIATYALIETQRKKGISVFLDYEHAFDVERAKSLGLEVSKERWIYRQPLTAEDGFKIIEKIISIIRSSDIKIPITVVIDSIASMVTSVEFEAGYDSNMKTKLSLASFLSVALKQIAGKASKLNITLIFLNQTRQNPSVMFGSNEYTAGGNAMKFYASVRLKLVKGKQIKNEDKIPIGEILTAKVEKNKISTPFKQATCISDYEVGIDIVATHISYLKNLSMFGNTKGWLEFEDKKYREKEFIQICRNNKEVYNKILGLFKESKDADKN